MILIIARRFSFVLIGYLRNRSNALQHNREVGILYTS